ncbi:MULTISPECIES: IclR family transcriptional regulator [Bacillus]|uniref:IclR family transcriptional regulator n=1 Tax=Bacillus TaxID=1386 RepID=UPI001CD4340D|nr:MULTISPECIES: IclR family transcriptional regulator [Bacillus]MCA1036648.1 IclR family transcriptional regulator [Bacillus infantis]
MSSKTVNKALEILSAFSLDTPAWGLRELSRHLNMSHTIVHRILSTFEEQGFIVNNPETHKYELGIKFIELGNVVEENIKISEMIQPIMKRLALETGESVVLTILDDSQGLFVKIVESEQSVRFSESVGKRSPLYIGASHKVILAYLPVESQYEIIEKGVKAGARQIGSRESFLHTMESIKEQGWFYTSGETFEEVAAIAVPLFDNKRQIIGSLSVAGPSYRLSEDKADSIFQIMREHVTNMESIFSKIFFPSKRNSIIKQLT